MLAVMTAEQMRREEAACESRGLTTAALMDRAGRAVARLAADAARGPVLVLVGPGNNGGDGLVAARVLAAEGHTVTLYSFRRDNLPEVPRAEADAGLRELAGLVASASVVVDALLGAGQHRPAEGLLADVLDCVNSTLHADTVRVSVDLPTGVLCDTGAVPGAAFKADHTVCLGSYKVANVVFPAAELNGKVHLVDIGLGNMDADNRVASVPTDRDIAALLPARRQDSNKGTSGRVLVVSGSARYPGAPSLVSLAAYRIGAGLVQVALPESVVPIVAAHGLEPIYLPLEQVDGGLSTSTVSDLLDAARNAKSVVCGPGLGQSDDTIRLVPRFLHGLAPSGPPVVVDADGLNALARHDRWWDFGARAVLTPHPGEMSRLTGLTIEEIQADRLAAAVRHARMWGKVVVLKGAGTIVAAPDGQAVVNPTGGGNLATAGTGDVLSGTIGGLLAQGLPPWEAAVAGVYVHGRAGDLLRDQFGPAGTLAGDLLTVLPRARTAISGEERR